MFWNKKKTKSKPQIKTTVPKTFKAKEPPPKWQPTFGETKKKDEKPPEVTTKSESKIDWENKFLKSLQTSSMGCVERLYFTSCVFNLECFRPRKLRPKREAIF